MISITRAPAYATIQDRGRRSYLSSGVPRSGAIDVASLDTLNALLGNDRNCAAIEWALTAGEIHFEGAATFAVGGARGQLSLAGRELEEWRAYDAQAGETLVVGAPEAGRFRYIGFGGGIECPLVMQSRSTYLPGGFGGAGGRRLRTGDSVAVGSRARRHQVSDALPENLRPSVTSEIRFVGRGEVLIAGSWTVSAASDRTGYRLQRETEVTGGSVTSEPVCPGTIQLPPGGEAIVLMADAPTIGGYMIAGGVISADLGALAQRPPGALVELIPVTSQQAQRAIEREAERLERVREWSLTA
jgi:biotin-dependent carboxylase-like uncharacterized protein